MSDIAAEERMIQERCDTLARKVLAWCEVRDVRIASAESLTGGLLADAFVRIPGASQVFLGSAVTYDIAAKASVLGVDHELLSREGAVHPDVAQQMATGAVRLYDQPTYGGRVIGLSTTGVAGPGPDGNKPAGLVYIGLSLPEFVKAPAQVSSVKLMLSGNREQIRRYTVLRVLENVSRFTADSQE